MAVVINHKICDNAQECGGILECPNKAIYWDEKEEKIKIDNSSCTSCHVCESACPVGAIRVADNDEELIAIQREIEADQRTVDELFVDRYGAMPLVESNMITAEQLSQLSSSFTGITIAECYTDDSIQCLAHSVPINHILSWFNQYPKYYKVCCNDSAPSYNISEYPALLLFRDGNFLGSVCGVYEILPENDNYTQEEMLREEILNLLD